LDCHPQRVHDINGQLPNAGFSEARFFIVLYFLCYNFYVRGDDMQYRKKQRLYFYLLIFNFFFFIGLSIILLTRGFGPDINMLILLLSSLGLAVSSFFINGFIMFYANRYHHVMLREFAEKPVFSKHELLGKNFALHMNRLGFSQLKNHGDFFTIHRYINDKANRFYRYGALEVIVMIINRDFSFSDPRVIQGINLIEDEYISQKQYINRYYIYNIKDTDTLTDDQRFEANQVQFERFQKKHITTLNLYYVPKEKIVYFLHSKSHSPNAYYSYAVDSIYKWIH
jgi:hypothetical protein